MACTLEVVESGAGGRGGVEGVCRAMLCKHRKNGATQPVKALVSVGRGETGQTGHEGEGSP